MKGTHSHLSGITAEQKFTRSYKNLAAEMFKGN